MSVCIVSAYYKIPSKQPHHFYREHLKRWFRAISQPVIFFTTPDIQSEIEAFGYNLPHVQFVHLPFEELNAWGLGRDFWTTQCVRDAEKYHTPELAAIWYEKKEFVKRAMTLSAADVFIWCDAGCIRNDSSELAARTFGSRTAAYLSDGLLHLQHIRPIPQKQYYTYPDSGIAGAILAGNRDAWNAHSALYDSVLQSYHTSHVSGNSDQYITMSCIQKKSGLYKLHRNTATTVDEWFFFLQTL